LVAGRHVSQYIGGGVPVVVVVVDDDDDDDNNNVLTGSACYCYITTSYTQVALFSIEDFFFHLSMFHGLLHLTS